MRQHVFPYVAALVIVAGVCIPALPSSPTPSADDEQILARVNGEPITLDAYYEALGQLHAGSMDSEQRRVSLKDPTQLLDRLINIELILQEASAIGLDEVPEFTRSVESFGEQLLKAAVLDHAVRDLPPPDPADVERRLVENETVFEISGIQFEKVEDAESFRSAVDRGEEFEVVATAYVADGRGTEFREHDRIKRGELSLPIADVLTRLEAGQVSSPISIGPVFAVVKIYGSSLERDPETTARAEAEVRAADRSRVLKAYVENLEKEYAKTDTELLDALDFEDAVDGYDGFLEDDRPLVQIKDADPIRVRDLAKKLKSRLFHGVEQAAKSERLNKLKTATLHQLTIETIVRLEGERLELDQTHEFQSQMREFEETMLFAQFLSRVLDPEVKVAEADIESYYAEHIADFTEPGMVRLDSLAFTDAETAQRALDHLNAGADMGWMRGNAAGQAAPDTIPEEMRFDRRLLIETSLTEIVRDTITGAVAGDFRLCTTSADRQYVLQVIAREPARTRPLDQVRGEIEQQLYPVERQQSLEEWMSRLREASEIELLVDEARLRSLLIDETSAAPEKPAPGSPGGSR